MSLLDADPANRKFFVGTRWKADIIRWTRVSITPHFVTEPDPPVKFSAEAVCIGGKRVIDWFTNHLLDRQEEISEFGWVVGLKTIFDSPQSVEISPGTAYLCDAISFGAERTCEKLEYLVGVSGTGFYDWNSKLATFPPGATIRTDAVPMDFKQWRPRTEDGALPTGFIEMHIFAHDRSFERVLDAINLDAL